MEERIHSIKEGFNWTFIYQPFRDVVMGTGRPIRKYKNNPRISVLTVVWGKKNIIIYAGKFPDWSIKGKMKKWDATNWKYIRVEDGMTLYSIRDKFVEFCSPGCSSVLH